MEFIGPLWDIVKYSCVHLKHRIDIIRTAKENFGKFKEEAQALYNRREDLSEEINSDTVFKKPTNECKAWLEKVEEIEKKVRKIEAEYRKEKNCLYGWCPDISSRYKLGKHIVFMLQEISELKLKSEFKGGVVVDAPTNIVEKIPTPMIEGETSIGCIMQEILRCLRNEEILKIGVWGMGGVGKTTITKILNNTPELARMFQIVIWVTVSKDWNLKKMQKELAQRFSLDIGTDELEDRVARKLCQKLETMKYLLILDDIWDNVGFGSIGVPFPTRENSCKIVLTSRSLGVCNKMGTDKAIKVDGFSEEEAWSLFRKNVGEVVVSPQIEPLARDVVKECDGLPLAIIVIAGSLRDVNDVHVWKNVLRELKRVATNEIEDMEELVYKRLKLSFDRLKNDNVKHCFLYCALYPEDFKIGVPELIDHWWVEGFLDGVENLEEAYDKGHAILNDLINASLLEKIESHYRHQLTVVKMHDVIRDLALKITSRDKNEGGFCRFLVKAGVGLEETPNEKEWMQVQRISLMYNRLQRLPDGLKCSSLSTLLLQGNLFKQGIPELSFEQIHGLRFLNLSKTEIWKFPSSLFNLVSLQGIFLDNCENLMDLPSEVGKLTRLEVLRVISTYGSGIACLPVDVGQLTRLKRLRVSFCDYFDSSLEMIPSGVLSRLPLLEDLSISIEDIQSEKKWSSTESAEVVAEELISLKRLLHLEFHFPKAKCLENFLQRSSVWKDQRLESFIFSCGHPLMMYSEDWDFEYTDERSQYLRLFNKNDVTSVVSGEVLSKSCSLLLEEHENAKNLLDIGSNDNLKSLLYCKVNRCSAIETIIDANGLSLAVLPNLEFVFIWTLPSLRTVWEGPVPSGSLAQLKVFDLWQCPKLRTVFSPGMIQQLPNLEELTIGSSFKIEEIVDEEEEMFDNKNSENRVVLFPRLKKLKLLNLQQLVRICKRVPNSLAWPSLNAVHICSCPNLKHFPFSIQNAPAMRMIEGSISEKELWEGLEWDDNATKQQFRSILGFQ